MQLLFLLFLGVLFFLLSPTILVRLPLKGSKFTVAAVHAAIFVAIVYLMTHFHVIEGVVNEKLTYMDGCNSDGKNGCGSRIDGNTGSENCVLKGNFCQDNSRK
jgi:hypothetical protein